MVILGYMLPVFIYASPFGTDAYSHIFSTSEMYNTNSLFDFYDRYSQKVLHPEWEGNPYRYPFGLWLFGSIVAKVTGVEPYYVAILVSIPFLLVILSVFYFYSNIFLDKKKQRILSLIFLLSMTSVSLSLLEYRPTTFVIPFLLLSIYFSFKKISLKHTLLMITFTFCLCFSHTGTYIFFISFSILFLILHALLWGKFQRGMFMLTVIILFTYPITMDFFPLIHEQYVTKGAFFLSTTESLSSNIHFDLDFFSTIGKIFYEEFFVNKSIIYGIFFSTLLYCFCQILVFIRCRIPKPNISIRIRDIKKFPLILPIQNVSHSIILTPFWIGPIHTILSLIGVFKINKAGKTIFLAVIIVTFIPGAIHTGDTGALREIYYCLVIIPIISSVGIYYILSNLESRLKSISWKLIIGLSLFCIFSSMMVIPIIGNIYYQPTLSGSDYLTEGMRWLSSVGNSNEGCTGYGYKMIDTYTDKIDTFQGVMSGTETTSFLQNLRSIFFTYNSEYNVREMYSTFDTKYFLLSDKIISNLGGTEEELKISSNKELDKLYQARDFEIYDYNLNQHDLNTTSKSSKLNFNETPVNILETAGTYLIETEVYKIRIDKMTPTIEYLGDRNSNFLGWGYNLDDITLSYYELDKGWQGISSVLNDFNYSSIILQDNQIIYKTILEKDGEKWATLIVKYTFYQKTVKKEIIMINDWLDSDAILKTRMQQFAPLSYFTCLDLNNVPIKRKIYGSQDDSALSGRCKEIYINDNKSKGEYIKYDAAPYYINTLTYQGSLLYDGYASISLSTYTSISPYQQGIITQYISIGDEKRASENSEIYKSVSLYPYPDGEIPIVLTSYIDKTISDKNFNFTSLVNMYKKLREINVSYTEGISIKNNTDTISTISQLRDYGINVMGYEDISSNKFMMQTDKIKEMKNNANIYNISLTGFVPKGLQYNQDTIKVLENNDIAFLEVIQDVRSLQKAFYHGNETNVVLIPVSRPTTLYLSNYNETTSSWKSVIDSVVENDEVCVFLWRSEDISNPEYIDGVIDVVNYAKNKGMTFTTPDKIAKHFILLQNVSWSVLRGVDTAEITINNKNDEPVEGVSFKSILPKIEEKCSYNVQNGRLSRVKSIGTKCEYYISTDIPSKETKILTIEPDITRKRFKVDIPKNPIEGEITIRVNDENGNPVEALLTLNTAKYDTDENGIVNINLRRGVYNITVEKPGFETESYELNVKGVIYAIVRYIKE